MSIRDTRLKHCAQPMGGSAGTVYYDIPSIDKQGLVPIERIALDNLPYCYAINTTRIHSLSTQKD